MVEVGVFAVKQLLGWSENSMYTEADPAFMCTYNICTDANTGVRRTPCTKCVTTQMVREHKVVHRLFFSRFRSVIARVVFATSHPWVFPKLKWCVFLLHSSFLLPRTDVYKLRDKSPCTRIVLLLCFVRPESRLQSSTICFVFLLVCLLSLSACAEVPFIVSQRTGVLSFFFAASLVHYHCQDNTNDSRTL